MTAKDNRSQAFLIVDGVKVIVINKDIFRIGRKKDNDIIIDNPHVSRHHARIQLIAGKYVLFDLESTVGTSVNGERVQEATLEPGDVISIGGAPIIFGIGAPEASLGISRPTDTSTGPTNSTDLEKLDEYLDLFDDKQ
ncbi:MAG: FHA domain-containing protein [Chloroflexi bacterium]|nr:FHA domain-containing protein [Chloroflexota bacterium]